MGHVPFLIADGAYADAGALGQLGLRQASGASGAPQQRAEREGKRLIHGRAPL
jgi:hypothetical protein